MSEQKPTRITITSARTVSFYSEQEAAHSSRLEIEIVRQLSDAGVIQGISVVGEERRYSDDDLALLRRVRRLYHDLGVNLEGIEIILRLQTRLDALQRKIEQQGRQ